MTSRPALSENSIQFDLVLPSFNVPGKKQLARLLAHDIAKMIGIKERILAERMQEREKASPSAMGGGTALIHLPISSLQNTISVFIKLKNPIDTGAPDNRPVDIICVMLTPEREGSAYLRTMARISRLLRNTQICDKLRMASDEKSIRNILEQSAIQLMAA